MKQAILFKGYALVDILHPCVSFNKVNTYQWFKENTYVLDSSHDSTDRAKAFEIAMSDGKLALGVIFKQDGRTTLTDTIPAYRDNLAPLYERKLDRKRLGELILSKAD
ncbi:MAG: hypothetical protein C4527_17860 [Candidatus Omnitrophota bacterium]|nr:MAG: hypothetical protein C4527_17860 [Candidatus Omnitrophota bacterium]